MREETEDPVYAAICRRVLEARGFDLAPYTVGYVKRRINVRLAALGKPRDAWADYLDILARDDEELSRLVGCISINVTSFFRDPPLWAYLRERLLPDLLRRKFLAARMSPPSSAAARQVLVLRIWSAACASGEEPYSIAMTISDILGPGLEAAPPGFHLAIVASDIDEQSLATGRAGIYPAAALESVKPAWRERYFVPCGHDRFQVKPRLRRMVIFQRHDFLKEKPFKAVDLVFFRNAGIYLDSGRRKPLLDKFHHALVPGGYLVLGMSELILGPQGSQAYAEFSVDEHVYRKA
ncbi:MAG: protein-glutamate O-methyltransferase CheR [Elusimicrobia bacterium]|nr:protein-glutamate O-methyltransferase CheR [Elusimicrobiota bacterium]